MGSIPQKRVAVSIILGTLALSAFFLAQGGTRLLAMNVLELDPTAGVRTRGGSGFAASSFNRRVDPTPLLRRNIFDSAQGDLTQIPTSDLPQLTETPGAPIDPNQSYPACSGSMRLVGSAYSPGRPDWSFAAISSGGSSLLYRKGMDVDGNELLRVEPNVVLMRSGSSACTLSMFEPAGPEQQKTVAPKIGTQDRRPSRAELDRSGGLSKEEMDSGIEKVSDTKFIIQRNLVDKILANQASLMRTARVIPHEEDGRVVGVKLYGIRRSSLLGRLGLQNGDMLRTINGFDMTSPDSALEAYARLRNSNNISVSLSRRGKPLTVEHVIQ